MFTAIGRSGVLASAGVALLGLATAGRVEATTADSRLCRAALGSGLAGVITSGFAASDSCHKKADFKQQPPGDCNDASSPVFDPLGKHAAAKATAATLINGKCNAGDPVLGNYDNQDPLGVVIPFIDGEVGGNSLLVVGSKELMGNAHKKHCLETIGRQRTNIVRAIVKKSVKCQAQKDAANTTFADIDPSCIDDGAKAITVATNFITNACTGLTGSDVGSCTSLPGCATDLAKTVAQTLVQAIYKKKSPPPTCGNGVVEGAEQCDDGANNGQPGDLCNTSCESLAETCGPGTPAGGSIIGHRVVTVSLTIPDKNGSPQELSGMQVNFDYPQLLASIPGTGGSSVVQNAATLLQSPPSGALTYAFDDDTSFTYTVAAANAFIQSGPVFKVTLDECVPLSTHTCSRSENVIGCCPGEDIPACQNSGGLDPNACFCDARGSVTAAQCSTASCSSGVCPGGGTLDEATCVACPSLPGCFSSFGPPVCGRGHFPPAPQVGTCDGTPSGPTTGCPSNSDCISQVTLTTASCGLTDPVDGNHLHVDGVTCSIAITEAP